MSCRKGSASPLIITPSKIIRAADNDNSELLASGAITVFEGASKDDPLWQLPVSHSGRHSSGYQVLAVAREALLQHPSSSRRDLDQLESGTPPHTGQLDPDGAGLDAWQVVLYSTSTTSALDIVHFIMKHKVAKGQILHLPTMTAACQDGSLASAPDPWTLDPRPAQLLKPFAAASSI